MAKKAAKKAASPQPEEPREDVRVSVFLYRNDVDLAVSMRHMPLEFDAAGHPTALSVDNACAEVSQLVRDQLRREFLRRPRGRGMIMTKSGLKDAP